MKKRILSLVIFTICNVALAQKDNTQDIDKLLDKRRSNDAHLSMAYQIPKGDLVKTFGNNFNVGVNFERLNWQNGFIFGVQGNYMFGQSLNIDPLKNLRTAEGELLAEGSYAEIVLRERGFFVGGHVGKLWTLRRSLRRISGIRTTLGVGFLQHWIRIQDNQTASAPQANGVYAQGYDRLTNGFALNQFIGYQMMSFNRGINFFAGFELTEGFTKNRRGFNFDTKLVDNAAKTDLLIGLRMGWIITIKMQRNAANIEY